MPKLKRQARTPQGELEEDERPIKVEIELSIPWKNLADFQNAWPQYKDYLIEYAALDKATLTIPPRAEEETIDL